MHLSRGYPWNLELSERELTTIEKALDIVTSEDDLDPDNTKLAVKLLFNIRNIHEKVALQKLQREGPQAEEELHSRVDLEKEINK